MTDSLDAGRVSILMVDPTAAELYLPSLRTRFEVTAVSTHEQAIRAMKAFQPTLVITELALSEGDGVAVCRAAKGLPANQPRVLVTATAADRVPEALLAGCDGVLMKPYAPILLYTRINRMLQQRPDRSTVTTNVVWHDEPCPSCGTGGIVSFDAASHRRMWFACLHCRLPWMAPSLDSLRSRRPLSRPGVRPAQRPGGSPNHVVAEAAHGGGVG